MAASKHHKNIYTQNPFQPLSDAHSDCDCSLEQHEDIGVGESVKDERVYFLHNKKKIYREEVLELLEVVETCRWKYIPMTALLVICTDRYKKYLEVSASARCKCSSHDHILAYDILNEWRIMSALIFVKLSEEDKKEIVKSRIYCIYGLNSWYLQD